jgi:hypothetical protein
MELNYKKIIMNFLYSIKMVIYLEKHLIDIKVKYIALKLSNIFNK